MCAACGNTPATTSPLLVTGLHLTPTTASVRVGDTLALSANADYADGTALDVTGGVVWSTNNALVVTVDVSGRVLAVAPGDTEVTATDARTGITQSAGIHVDRATSALGATAIALTPTEPILFVGETLALNAAATLADGSFTDVKTRAVWETSQPSVAEVDASGLLTPRASGQTVVTARLADDGVLARTTVTVRAQTIASLVVDRCPTDLVAGETRVLSALATLADATTDDVTEVLQWRSRTPDTVRVSNDQGSRGRIQVLTPGIATIEAASFTGSISATCTVSVAARLIDTVIPANTSYRLVRGEARSLEVLGVFNDGTARNVADSLVWTASAPGIVDVKGAALTALAPGVVDISATEPVTNTAVSIHVDVGTYADLTVGGAAVSLFQTSDDWRSDPRIEVADNPLGTGPLLAVHWSFDNTTGHYRNELLFDLGNDSSLSVYATADGTLSGTAVMSPAAYEAPSGTQAPQARSYGRIARSTSGDGPYIVSIDASFCDTSAGCDTPLVVRGVVGTERSAPFGTAEHPFRIVKPHIQHVLTAPAYYVVPTGNAASWRTRLLAPSSAAQVAVYADQNTSGSSDCTVVVNANGRDGCTYAQAGADAIVVVRPVNTLTGSLTYTFEHAMEGRDQTFTSLPSSAPAQVTAVADNGFALASRHIYPSTAGTSYTIDLVGLTEAVTFVRYQSNGAVVCAQLWTPQEPPSGCLTARATGSTMTLDVVIQSTTDVPYRYGTTFNLTVR